MYLSYTMHNLDVSAYSNYYGQSERIADRHLHLHSFSKGSTVRLKCCAKQYFRTLCLEAKKQAEAISAVIRTKKCF